MANKEELVIRIDKIGDKGNNYYIKSGEDFYSGFKSYQGKENSDYAQLQCGNHNEPFQEGDMARIVFTKKVGKDKEGNDKIYKNLVGIYPADTPEKTGKPAQAQPNTYHKEEPQTRNWDKEAYEKCCSIWAAAWIQRTGVCIENFDKFWELFQAIRKDGEKRFATGWAKAQATFEKQEPSDAAQDAGAEPYPIEMQPITEYTGQDIPF